MIYIFVTFGILFLLVYCYLELQQLNKIDLSKVILEKKIIKAKQALNISQEKAVMSTDLTMKLNQVRIDVDNKLLDFQQELIEKLQKQTN